MRTGSKLIWLFLLLFPLAPSDFAQSPVIKVRLLNELNTGESKAGQTFSGTLAEPLMSGRTMILPKGAAVRGRVAEVVSSGRLKRPASITLQVTDLGTRGKGLRVENLKIDGDSHAARDVALIGGGAAAGAILGGVAAGGKGAAIGGAAGAGAGTAAAYLTGKKEIVLPAETLLTFRVAADSLPQPDPGRGQMVETTMRPPRQDWHREGDDRDAYDAIIFSERDQEIIRAYYRPQGGGLPPGLAKRNGNLPPGLAKQLSRNGTLPPGLQKRAETFPMELTRQLPRLPVGYPRVMVEGRAMIVASDNTIIDVMAVF